jgi:hypothetical protein
MGQNTLANIMPMAAAERGIDRRTYHSVRELSKILIYFS